MLTLGNHTWRRKELLPYLNGSEKVARPGNYSLDAPGTPMVYGAPPTEPRWP